MRRASEVAGGALGLAGMGIRRELKRIYATPEQAEKAIREAMKDREAIEMWATIVTAKEERASLTSTGNLDGSVSMAVERGGAVFSFAMLPPDLRESAAECLAAAMLVWNAKEEEEARAS